MRRLLTLVAATAALLLTASPALACGGLIGPNGAVNLLRTTTFAGYHDGVEHYVTASSSPAGRASSAASCRCRACRPTSCAAATGRSSGWCRRRHLVPESAFFALAAAGAAEDRAEVLLETKIDALEITVLRGGGDEVGLWATDHGFRLPPDAPEVLDFYANRSPIFMAARFDADAARERGQAVGDGTPVHLTIPTDNPWVPLRILALGKTAAETDRGRCVPADRRAAGHAARSKRDPGTPGLSLDHSRAGELTAACRPALGQGHGVGARRRRG